MNSLYSCTVLAAEGYFTLVYATFRYLIFWHRHNLPNKISWLEPNDHINARERRMRILEGLTILPAFLPNRIKENPLAPIHAALVVANAVIM